MNEFKQQPNKFTIFFLHYENNNYSVFQGFS